MTGKKLIAYCLTENLEKMKEQDIKMLDSIHVAFGLLENGEVCFKETNGKRDLERIRRSHPAVKLVLAIGGWAADGFSQAARTAEGRKRFADSAAVLLQEYGFDGVDIDWEYPCLQKAGISSGPEDKENFTLLLRDIRERLNDFADYKTLSIAAGAFADYLENTQMEKAARYLDYVQLMTYDFYGGWDTHTGHHAALYGVDGRRGCADSVRLFVSAGVPEEKLVLGAAFYSREWTGVPEGRPGSPAKAGGEVHSYEEVQALRKNPDLGYVRYWEEEAKAAYLYNGDVFISYEDEQALACKAAYVKKHHLYGMMYWEYGQDGTYTLTRFLKKELG